MKIPEGTRNILCVCTGGKDRSPIMAKFFRDAGYNSKSVGISSYHTKKNGTEWCSNDSIAWADLIVVVSPLHEAFIRGLCRGYAPGFSPKIRVVDLKDRPEVTDIWDFKEYVLGVMRKAFPV